MPFTQISTIARTAARALALTARRERRRASASWTTMLLADTRPERADAAHRAEAAGRSGAGVGDGGAHAVLG